ncbi:hypothetical protein B0H14DRAFT_2395250, partial [Mycena olivaceomarginata]
SLLHRHFPMCPDERLVAVDGVSVPWQIDTIKLVNEGNMVPGGSVVAQAFIFDAEVGKGFYPFEYKYTSQESSKDHSEASVSPISLASAPLAFLQDIGQALVKYGLQALLGLRAHPGSLIPRLEFTADRANITLPIKAFNDVRVFCITFIRRYLAPLLSPSQGGAKIDGGLVPLPIPYDQTFYPVDKRQQRGEADHKWMGIVNPDM